MAQFKAQILNDLVSENGWPTVLELGCGDGAQLALARYPAYVGVDVSSTAVETCRRRFANDASKRFIVLGAEPLPVADVGLSLDVLYHLVEDRVFESYMTDLIGHSKKAVVLYTSDLDGTVPDRVEPSHIRHRPIQRWMKAHCPEWTLAAHVPNPYPYREDDEENTSFADFLIYEHR